MKFKVFKVFGEKAGRTVRAYKNIWLSRIEYAITHVISMREFYGRKHEGEAGLLIARFVKETFKSVGVVRRISKLSSTSLGKAYLAYSLIDIVKGIDKSKVNAVFQDIKKIKDLSGLEFVGGLRDIIYRHFDGDTAKRIDKMLGLRVSSAVVSETCIYDPVAERAFSIDPVTGKFTTAKVRLDREGAVEELFMRGMFDRSKDIFSTYVEWRMLKIIDEGMAKGLKGSDLGQHVFVKLRDELTKDDYFMYAFNFYLAKHIDRLEKSEQVSAAFGELLVQVSAMYRRLVGSVVRAAASVLPFFGSLAEVGASLGEGVGELGENIGRAIKKSKEKGGIRTVKVKLGQKDDLIGFF